jgi:hypothetical protein
MREQQAQRDEQPEADVELAGPRGQQARERRGRESHHENRRARGDEPA